MSTVQSPKHPKFISEEGADIYSRSKPDGIRFRFVSYNILARDPEWADDKLAKAKLLLSCLTRFKTSVSERFECTPSVPLLVTSIQTLGTSRTLGIEGTFFHILMGLYST
ncbi:uncharacterized protein LOC111480806 isoform X2 [Cucurbita maxima]|nr:uncharacterized protein LOC111480806 isoform X2 [Cucurbita maxima]